MKQSIHALSLTSHVNNWLVNSGHPRILHVFDRACNLINERREVLSVVTPQVGDGPINLVLEDEICFRDYLNHESRASVSLTQLTLGSLIIDIAHAKLWNPQPNWEMLHLKREDIRRQLKQLPTLAPGMVCLANHAGVTNCLKQDGLERLLLNHAGLPIPHSLISNLSSSLAIGDISSSLTSAQQLAGLGVGLTPSGDDIMMGAIYAAWIIHPFDVAGVIAQEIANTAAPLTTSLSAAWLRAAGRGEAGSLWHKFFDALVSANYMQTEETMSNILAIGETSGADALAGFTGVFVAWMESAGSYG